MLTILNRFVFFIAVGVIAYLAYAAVSQTPRTVYGKQEIIPIISKEMLNPVFVEPQAYNSPVSRDPFVVNDANNPSTLSFIASQQFADGSDDMDSAGKLMGIIIGDDSRRLALIGGKIYSVGSLVKLPNSDELWQVSSIDDKSVTLTSNEQQAVLKISDVYTDYTDFDDKDTEADVMEDENYGEYVQ